MPIVDLTGQILQGQYPMVARTADVTIIGGTITGPPEYTDYGVASSPVGTPWSDWHDTAGVVGKKSPRVQVLGTRFDMTGDAVTVAYPEDTDWVVRGCEMTRVHDDAIENDTMTSGTIDDCLIDGCYDFLSERYGTPANNNPPDGSGNLVSITDSLIRLRPYYNTFRPTTYGYGKHGPFFKWVNTTSTAFGIATDVEISNCVFACEMNDPYGYGIDLCPRVWGADVQAENVTLMWLGPGTWPEAQLVRWRAYTHNLSVKKSSMAEWNERANDWRAKSIVGAEWAVKVAAPRG